MCFAFYFTDGISGEANLKNTSTTLNFAQENQAIKRQKLEGGKSRQKSRLGFISRISNLCSSTLKTR
ncbi:hypothetical protein U1Q18_008836 [Sarracenia purpurea var. burkii]